ncbi:MAG: hypothetical protein IH911_01410 [Proteobacteria bacterium]|nr:hypothetical protein [Pseudomonadota bacterium]
MQRLTLFMLLTLSCFVATAQAPATDEELEVRRYTVEIVIFTYAEDISVGTELFVPDPPPADTLLDVISDTNLSGDDGEIEAPQLRDLEFLLLTEDDFTMDDVISRFEQLDIYETIMHVGWTQPTYPQDETATIDLRALGEPPQGLGGSFTLYLGRYLHLVVDLALDEQPGVSEAVTRKRPTRIYGDYRIQHEIDAFRETGPVRYRIQENRIFKNGDIRYFDHPKFGVVAKVTRVEDEETEDEIENTD